MDKLANWTNGAATNSGQNCEGNSSILITAPKLEEINQQLKWIFPLHSYGFGCLFFVLSFYTLFSIINLRSVISIRPFMTSINVFLCVLGVSRSCCLFVDPYNLQETMPKMFGSLIWDIGLPCVISAFGLVQLAFLHLTQLKTGVAIIEKESCISLLILSYFACILASDVALAVHNHFMTKHIVQLIFNSWSMLLYMTYLYVGYKVIKLLKNFPNLLTRDNSSSSQKAMLAPYDNLATSVATTLVPTLMSQQKFKSDDSETPVNANGNQLIRNNFEDIDQFDSTTIIVNKNIQDHDQGNSTVPEVYVRPPTPTPSSTNLPIITVSCASRRSSVASSRRGSDASRGSRRNSECSIKEVSSIAENDQSPTTDRPRTPECITRRHSDMPTPTGSTKDIRRCSDFTHEKNRSSQFAMKLRRNSDFGNRTPKRLLEETPRLPKVLDVSPAGSRRNSDIGGLAAVKIPESRRNSDISYRRNSDLAQMKPLIINRRTSDVSIRSLDKSPTHFQNSLTKLDILEKPESDSEQIQDCSEKAALMANDKPKDKVEEPKNRKKSLSWKNIDTCRDDDDIKAESSLLSLDNSNNKDGGDFTLQAILNHIAHVNRSKSNIPLYIPETGNTSAVRSQFKRVLHVIYATAIMGVILCGAEVFRIIGPYGLTGDTVMQGQLKNAQHARPIPWFIFQTICRGLELIMGCAMASITKEPSVSPRHPYFQNYNSSYRLKNRGTPYI